MHDHFDRLLARVSGEPGPSPFVRPRLPHVFERPATGPVADLEAHDEVTPRPFLTPTPERPPGVPGPVRPEPSAPPPPALVGIPEHRAHGPADAIPEGMRAVERTEPMGVAEAVRRLVERIEVRRGPLLAPASVPGPVPAAGERSAPSVTSPGTPFSHAGNPAVPPAGAAPGERWRVTPAVRQRAEQGREVRISIGRLEVNATRPERPTPPPRPGRPAPTVSLEAYLAGGDGRP
ncbi:hypothetical protein Ssi03_69040 [Sphaerisporangium siamense]|uniref:Uncharacterized protein n=1 Tax=Sphaerisporangium siamense TaxID=795645 RepID=A0A7W7GB17_9ACTN|nr:hypothetical protein [Sphaerisporangium siamense]MBB4700556.1 hypothetical protein [Sphaerisporangium siamense]GII88914.1 hypothetical protein Ssi03_69040 [Sphaerisporangium siamense]